VVVHNLVVENREVKSKTKSDWVAGVQTLGSLLSELVVLESSLFHRLDLIRLGALSNVSVVVSHHLVEESFGLVGSGNLHAGVLDGVDDLHTLVIELTLNFSLVGLKSRIEFLVFRVLLDGGNGSDSSPL
jgi:hypothetical protein